MEARPGAQQASEINALDIADSPFCDSSLPRVPPPMSNQNEVARPAPTGRAATDRRRVKWLMTN